MLRTFIAVKIEPNEELRSALEDLRELGRSVQPTKIENLHVTLKFLGETDERIIPEIGKILQGAVADRQAWEVRLHGLGAFPNVNRPTVVWIGLRSVELLEEWAQIFEREFVKFGYPPEKRPLV